VAAAAVAVAVAASTEAVEVAGGVAAAMVLPTFSPVLLPQQAEFCACSGEEHTEHWPRYALFQCGI